MVTIEAVKQAVTQLPPEEFAKFRQWLAEFQVDAWDARSPMKTEPGTTGLTDSEFDADADQLT